MPMTRLVRMAVASLGNVRAHLVDDEQTDALDEAVRPLTSDHVPLLWRRDDQVRALHLPYEEGGCLIRKVALTIEPGAIECR